MTVMFLESICAGLPSPSPTDRHSRSDWYFWSKDDSIQMVLRTEVEAALSALDNELEQTEDVLTE